MSKIRKCSKSGCDKPRMKRPGNTNMYFKFCTEHQIKAVLSKQRSEAIKDKQELEKVRKTARKTGVDRFYSSTAWYWCSKYVLLYYSDTDLNVRCSTSPHLIYRITDKSIHCGHYFKCDQHKSVALEFVNLFPQSYSDNVHFSGKPEIAKEWIIAKHGIDKFNWLERKKNETYKLDAYELDMWAKHYRTLFNQLLIDRNINNPWK